MDSTSESTRKGGRPKGTPKTGGRKKGTSNKRTYWLRDELERVGFDWALEIKKSFEIDNFERIQHLYQMLPYLNPRIEALNVAENDPNRKQDDGVIDILKATNG